MRLFRCRNCNREFRADVPACEACGLDAAKDPRDEGVVVEMVTIHFDPPTKVVGRGQGHAACDPRIKVGTPGVVFTGDRGVANCEACKTSVAFARADESLIGMAAIPIGKLPEPAAG